MYFEEILRHLISKLRSLIGYPVVYNANRIKQGRYHKRALLIYLVSPFFWRENSPAFSRNQNSSVCKNMSAVLGELGYIVDVADINDQRFVPRREYDLVISHRVKHNFDEALFGRSAIKIYLSTGMNHIIHNENLKKRYDHFCKRRGSAIPIRWNTEDMPYLSQVDAIIGFGNEHTFNSWGEVFKGPKLSFNNYAFQTIKFINAKDFGSAKKKFLFFASGPQIGKGLDLLLEIFPKHPHLTLYVCSSFKHEKDFCRIFKRELYETANIVPVGLIAVGGRTFYDLCRNNAYVILPSAEEGQAGSVLQCMAAGLIPVLTKEVGIDTENFGVTLQNDRIDEIESVILELSSLPDSWHRQHSIRTRQAINAKYNERSFCNRFYAIIKEIVEMGELRREYDINK